MRNWTDEGIILDLANDNPGLNDQGVQIEASDWAVGSAWHPALRRRTASITSTTAVNSPTENPPSALPSRTIRQDLTQTKARP